MNNSNLIISTEPEADSLDEGPDIGLEGESRPLVFGELHHAKRLDLALAELVPEFSRSYLQQLITSGAVSINGALCLKPSSRVKVGDFGSIELRPTPQSQAFKPEPMDLQIVYEDEYLRVINKPSGLVVHPAPGNWSGTLLNGLLAHDEKATLLPRAGIVHRLDKDTSGLMVVARTRSVMDSLVKLIAAHEVSRQYLALAHRPWIGAASLAVDAPIGRDPRNRLRMAVVDLSQNQGKLAKTEVHVLERAAAGCLVKCVLHTGRTHQIRVHMASIGHPLVADEVYGGAQAAGMKRQALHAFHLSFSHPASGQIMVFRAPLPDDLKAALVDWGLSYNLG